MLFKLAWRNLHRSVRDYAVYFVTLLVGVAMFYAFNSIESQQVLFDMRDSKLFTAIGGMLNLVSGVIACVLGFLVVYANQFLIKRRKREFGVYLTLGMAPGAVSRIVLYETVMVGIASLAVGLLLGVGMSQGLSFVSAAIMGTTLSYFQFLFSPSALVMTVVCFAVVFLVVTLFNVVSVSRYKLVTLLHAESQSQRNPVRSPWVCLAVFIASIAVLAYAYQQLMENGLVMLDDPTFTRATVFMLLGSLMFFWSLAGFVIAVLTKAKGVYLRGLVPFTVRQIASRVNTAFLSLWAVCVMVFFAVTVFSSGMGLLDVLVGDIFEANPYSASLRADVYWEDYRDLTHPSSKEPDKRARAMQDEDSLLYARGVEADWRIAPVLQEAAPQLWDETIGADAQMDIYEIPGLTYNTLLDAVGDYTFPSEMITDLDANLLAVGISQFNHDAAIIGKDEVSLGEGECFFANNVAAGQGLADAAADASATIDAYGTALRFTDQVSTLQICDSAMKGTVLLLVVPDSVIESLADAGAIPFYSYLNLMYKDNGRTDEQNDDALKQVVGAAQPVTEEALVARGFSAEGAAGYMDRNDYLIEMWPVTMVVTASEQIMQSGGLKLMVTYLAIYIGVILLIATAAILAIQSLSQAVDSERRYRMLGRIGADSAMLGRSLFAQTFIYFLVPVGLAACHSACAIGVLGTTLYDSFGVSIFGASLTAAGLLAVIYGLYFLVTYFASRSIVNQSLKAR